VALADVAVLNGSGQDVGILVMKFGGMSVGTLSSLSQVLSIVLHEANRRDHLLLVVSALEGVTDDLLEAAHLARMNNRRGYRRIIATLRTRHLALVDNLPIGARERGTLQADVDRLLFEMANVCQTLCDEAERYLELPPQLAAIDRIISTGERLGARIVAALLRQNDLRGVAIDATDLLVTDDVFSNATPDMALSRQRIKQNLLPMLQRKIIPVVTGFIGATADGRPTTLGRGGSDLTASILAVGADADEVWIWTDVDGIMSTDPHEIAEAQVIHQLSYEEVAELAYFGARILHSRMVGPLAQQRIPLRVKNVLKAQHSGTLVQDQTSDKQRTIKAVASIGGIALSAPTSGPLSTLTQIVDQTLFAVTGSHAEVMLTSQSSAQSLLCFVIPTTAGQDVTHTVQHELEAALRGLEGGVRWRVQPVTIITAIGAKIDETPALIGRLLMALEGIRILALAQDTEMALRCVHQIIIAR
jgi:bifunctional aspartokinase / homoserine dehydrogenase 1